ncbi:MAG: hypothetical protein AAGI01_08800 [Myxococcota bacterium]
MGMQKIRRTVLAATLCAMWAMPAAAEGEKERGMSSVLGSLDWGDSPKKVITKLKEDRLEQLRRDSALKADQVLMQQARKEALDWNEGIEKSYTKLEGKRTGYEFSVVSSEFTPNVGESLIRARDKIAQRFYFFKDGRLYKLVVAYDKDYLEDVEFEDFAVQTARKYGRPMSTEYGELYGAEELVAVKWQDQQTILDVQNKAEFFGTYVMVFSDRGKVKRLKASGSPFGGSDRSDKDEGISSEVAALTSGTSKADDSVLDELVGEVELDLNEGRPEGEKLREQPEVADTSAPKEKKQPSKKKKSKKRKRRKPKKGLDRTKSLGDELIIY